MPMVSKSGFIIKDVYVDLEKSMSTQNHVRTCHLTAELVCSGEIRTLTSWVISLICNRYIGTNSFILEFASKRLLTIQKERYQWKNMDVRISMCVLLLLLSKEEMTTSQFYKVESYTKETKEFVESLFFKVPKSFRELRDNLSYVVENDVYFTVVRYMYELMLKNDIKNVFKIMHFILQSKKIDECETLDIVHDVKKSKNDPVWLLWKVLFIFAERPPTNSTTILYIQNAFNIFSFEYNRKIRNERLNLLFVCYIICVRRKEIVYLDTYDNFIKGAASKIGIIYDELVEKETRLKQAAQEKIKKDKQEKVKKEIKIKSNLTPEEQQELDKKMKAFFVLTYQRQKTPHSYSHPNIPSEHSYKMVNVSSHGEKEYNHLDVDKL